MSLILWTPQLEVKIDDIDQQHKEMAHLANVFYRNLYDNTAKTELAESFNNFFQCTIAHFNYEEKLMEKYNDPNKIKHTGEHAEFVNELKRLKTKVISGDLKISVEIIEFFRNNIINHIFVADKEMAGFILSNSGH